MIFPLLSSAESFIAWLLRDGWCRLTGAGRSPYDFAARDDFRVARCLEPGRSAADMQLTSSPQATVVCSSLVAVIACAMASILTARAVFWFGHGMTCDILALAAHSRPRSSRSRDAVPEPSGRSRTSWVFSANTR
jgi:hypothetical protein